MVTTSISVHEIVMYLRKSRSDNPDESVAEVLRKHETILQEFCLREYGEQIPESNIYREIVSGESIENRVEMKKLLSKIESTRIKAILVVEPQRLSRGDLMDCGLLINTLLYTKTLIITPVMTYDMSNKMEQRFFTDELMRGRDYLDYVKEILQRGKLASVKRGCYLPSRPPYGYDRIKVNKNNTLMPNSDADTVRMIFTLFADGVSSWHICKKLESLGIRSPLGHKEWNPATIDKMIRNAHYIGKITYQKDKRTTYIVNGQKITKRTRQPDYLICDGLHEAIIDDDLFMRAQDIINKRPPVGDNKILRNAFAGLLRCGCCGKPLIFKDKGTNGIPRNYIYCGTKGCIKMIRYEVFGKAVIDALERVELPALEAKLGNEDQDVYELQKMLIKHLETELFELREQEETQFELLEKKQYTEQVFAHRHGILAQKIEDTENKLRQATSNVPKKINYAEKVVTLKKAISALKDDGLSPAAKNYLLKSIVKKIEYTSDPAQKRGQNDMTIKITLAL